MYAADLREYSQTVEPALNGISGQVWFTINKQINSGKRQEPGLFIRTTITLVFLLINNLVNNVFCIVPNTPDKR